MKNIAVLLSVLGALPSSYAWGALGHETVAYLASNYLEPATVTWAQTILKDTSSSYLASVAAWADSYRETKAGRFSAPYHFIDALDSPPTTCNVEFKRDCSKGGCVVSALSNYTARVQNTKLSATDINQALMFIVHFVGDIHQPLHDEYLDLGGNKVIVSFNGVATNLHAVWDTSIPQTYAGTATLANAEKWAATLATAINTGPYSKLKAGWLTGIDVSDPIATATEWARSANAYVCTAVMPNGIDVLNGTDLGGVYYTDNLPVVQQQIATAGYRLAAWLNLIVTGNTGMNSTSATAKSENRIYHDSLRRLRRGHEEFNACSREL